MNDYNKLLNELGKNIGELSESQEYKAFKRLSGTIKTEGKLSPKIKELMMVALAVKSQCISCITAHVKEALDLGASNEEVIESAWTAVLMGGGPALAYLLEVVKALKDYTKTLKK